MMDRFKEIQNTSESVDVIVRDYTLRMADKLVGKPLYPSVDSILPPARLVPSSSSLFYYICKKNISGKFCINLPSAVYAENSNRISFVSLDG